MDFKETDESLALKAQQGNLEAEEFLIRKYKETVKARAGMYFMAGGDEQDVIQEGMIGLVKAIGRFDPARDASFATFASICITTQIISAIRGSERKKHEILNSSISLSGTVSENSDTLVLADTVSDSQVVGPEEMLLQKDMLMYILRDGEKILSDFERQVITELIRGESCDDIGAKLGKSSKSIDNAARRAKKKIIEYIRR